MRLDFTMGIIYLQRPQVNKIKKEKFHIIRWEFNESHPPAAVMREGIRQKDKAGDPVTTACMASGRVMKTE